MTPPSEHIFRSELEALLPIYQEAKGAVILAEKLGDSEGVSITSINEMRNALDHIFRALELGEDSADFHKEINEAKEHLYRVAFDAYYILINGQKLAITKALEEFGTEVISVVFPEYYREIKDEIADIEQKFAEIRKDRMHPHRQSDEKGRSNPLFENAELATRLKHIQSRVNRKIPALSEYHAKKRQENEDLKKKARRDKLLHWSLTLVVGVTVGLVVAIAREWIKVG